MEKEYDIVAMGELLIDFTRQEFQKPACVFMNVIREGHR